MDGLQSDKQRALAWLATWNPSFTGKAILDKDFQFLSVNDQFCEILGITPAEVLSQKFTDVTAPKDRELDKQNAQMVIEGKSKGYLLKKTYEFADGRQIPVILLVAGVYKENGEFDFFASRIVSDTELLDTSPIPKERSWWDKILIILTIAMYAGYEIIKSKFSVGQ